MTTATKGLTSIFEKLFTAGSEALNGAAGRDGVEETAKLLAAVVVNHYTGGVLGEVPRPSCAATLLRVSDHMSERHNKLFSRYNISCFLIRCMIRLRLGFPASVSANPKTGETRTFSSSRDTSASAPRHFGTKL